MKVFHVMYFCLHVVFPLNMLFISNFEKWNDYSLYVAMILCVNLSHYQKRDFDFKVYQAGDPLQRDLCVKPTWKCMNNI